MRGTTSWIHLGQPLRKRVQALRTLWDLRWHGENREIATRPRDPQVSACPIRHRFWSQAHVLCDCPGTTGVRTEGALDLTIAINRLPPGPMLELGCKFKSLLIIPNQPDLMARRWAGQWDHAAIEALRPEIANCTRKQIKAILGQIGRVTSSTAAASSPLLLPPQPLHDPSRMGKPQPSTGILTWARTTDKHRDPNPMLRQATDRACYSAQWGRGGVLCALPFSTRSMCS